MDVHVEEVLLEGRELGRSDNCRAGDAAPALRGRAAERDQYVARLAFGGLVNVRRRRRARQLRVRQFPLELGAVRVALNKPCAAASLTTCFGTSWPDDSAAVQTVL